MKVTDLYALNGALKRDEREIRIEDPALTELRVLAASDVNALKQILSGSGLGLVLGLGGLALGFATSAVLLPFALLGAGIFKMGKSITYDFAKGIKTDKQLRDAQNQIADKYKGLNVKEMFKLINSYYDETSSGKSYSVLRHN